MKGFSLLAMTAMSAWGAEIILPAPPQERSRPVPIIDRTSQLATGKSHLSLRWTDAHRRLVDDRKIPVKLLDENEIGFTVDLPTIRDRLVKTARFYASYRPLSDSLGDERGVAALAAFWDFDFADESLVPMRCLSERYGGLDALNEQWGELGIRFAAATTASIYVLDVVNPSGQIVGYYSGNLLASEGRAGRLIPFALNDPPALWEIRVKDLFTGQFPTPAVEVD
jgi:hypothetical protein